MFRPASYQHPSLGTSPNPVTFDLVELLRKDRTFVDLPEVVLSSMVRRTGIAPTILAKRLGVSAINLQRYLHAHRSMPLNVLRAVLQVGDVDALELQGKIRMRIGRSGTRVLIGPSLVIDEEMVYVAELVRCDGHLPKNMSMVVFVNKELDLISRVRRFFKEYGLKNSNMSLKKINGVYFLRVYSRLFAAVLHAIFGIPLGKKGDMKVPQFILASPNSSVAMVRAAFDAEGNVQVQRGPSKSTPRRVVITNKSKKYLKGVKQAMVLYNIESRIYREVRPSGPIFRLVIYHQQNLARFLASVGPFHPKRRARLVALLSSYRKDRIPEGSLRPSVLRAIAMGNNTRRLIATGLGLSSSRVGNQLYRLRKLALVAKPKVVGSSSGRYGIYELTKKGEEFLCTTTDKGLSSLALPR